jgi:nicotinamide riboside kinase
MKLAGVGSMGVGKTTLVNEVAKVMEWTILPELAREMMNAGYKLDKGVDVATEYVMIEKQIELEQYSRPWIADRCLIDIWAYCKVLFPDEAPLLNTIVQKLKETEYDIIVYIPPEFPIEDDGIRSTDTQFQTNIDNAIKEILCSFEHYTVTGSVEKRTKTVVDIINKTTTKQA